MSEYSPEERREIVLSICAEHATGKTIREIFEEMPGIGRKTLYRWLADDPDLRHQYQQAHEMYEDELHDCSHKIAKAAEKNLIYDKFGNSRIDPGAVQAARLQCDVIQWTLGRSHKRKYTAATEGAAAQGTLPVTVIEGQEKLDEPLK